MPHTTVIRKADWIIGWDLQTETHTYLRNADIAFTDDKITFVGNHYDGPADTEISGKSRMVMPGLIDIHCHSGDEPIAKGIFDDVGTSGGARALGRDDIGRLAPGAKADIVLIDLDHPAMRPVHDPIRNLILCAAERAVHQVFVDGELVVDQGAVKNFDYFAAAAELQSAQDRAIALVPELDGKGRSVDDLAPRSFPLVR